ncbi:MAG: PEP-CTERM sorting domain-containing protein [Planctomycetes bacterium]|nr:PEP-CTERM sorting domain-containing protein [Planctomycetota bacterium]
MRPCRILLTIGVVALVFCATAPAQVVFPTNGHAASNFIPFGSGSTTMHQVFDANLFASRIGGQPIARITEIAHSPGVTGTFNLGPVDVNLGYTNLTPGNLGLPSGGGNPSGPLDRFFSDPNLTVTITRSGSEEWGELILSGLFDYDPSLGNLLVEVILPNANNTALHISRAAGNAESTRAYDTSRFGSNAGNTTATRMQFTFTGVPEPSTLLLVGLAGLLLRRR